MTTSEPRTGSSRRSGLGRGLGALIPADATSSVAEAERGVLEVPVGRIHPNPRQPRRHFDEEALAGLTASVAELGVLQPVLVRRRDGDDDYELIAGERRWRACKRAGRQTIPVIVRDASSDATVLEEALVENLHRSDLNAMEEAAAFQQLVEDFGLTQEEVVTRVGKSRAAVANTLRLFQLPPAIQALVVDGAITAGHARALLGTPDRAFQTSLAQRIVRDGLSVRDAEEAVRARTAPAGAADAPTRSPSRRSDGGDQTDAGLLELEQLLADHLDTRVAISGRDGRGRVSIEFADVQDLERIYRRIVE